MREVAEGSELDKLITTYYWSEAIAEGRGLPGDGMYYDFSNMSDEQIQASFARYIGMMTMFYRPGYYHGDSIEQYRDRILANGKKIKVGSIFEYTMGGIMIDKDMNATVPGLFAAGEAGSGVFGACRIADATTEMLVQGWKAGRSAGEYVKHADHAEPGQVADRRHPERSIGAARQIRRHNRRAVHPSDRAGGGYGLRYMPVRRKHGKSHRDAG